MAHTNTFLSERSSIDQFANVSHSMLTTDNHITGHATVLNSILFNHARIGERSLVTDSIFLANSLVNGDVILDHVTLTFDETKGDGLPSPIINGDVTLRDMIIKGPVRISGNFVVTGEDILKDDFQGDVIDRRPVLRATDVTKIHNETEFWAFIHHQHASVQPSELLIVDKSKIPDLFTVVLHDINAFEHLHNISVRDRNFGDYEFFTKTRSDLTYRLNEVGVNQRLLDRYCDYNYLDPETVDR